MKSPAAASNWKRLRDGELIGLPAFHQEVLEPGENVKFTTCVGGGCGDPTKRDTALTVKAANHGRLAKSLRGNIIGWSCDGRRTVLLGTSMRKQSHGCAVEPRFRVERAIQNIHRDINFRIMTSADIGSVPTACQGNEADLRARIEALGAAAVLAFDGAQHVAQLQFRKYDRTLRSPDGLWDPLYWGDFGDDAPDLPANSLSIFCYHVGQTDDSERRDARYQGRGLGLALLDYFLAWASDAGFSAVAAKATPAGRAVMGFMGGQPAAVYQERGFEVVGSWIDSQLRDVIHDKGLVPEEADLNESARVSCCVRSL